MKLRRNLLLCGGLATINCCTPSGAFQARVKITSVRRDTLVFRQDETTRLATIFEESSCLRSHESASLPPVIQKIADNRAEFQINLGHAMDTLRRDMPDILMKTPGELSDR